MNDKDSKAVKEFSQRARVVYTGVVKKGKGSQRSYANNICVQLELLEKTL